jgi:arabinofuranan 3-O-arabinosyltransferase
VGTANEHGYVIPPRYWKWLANRRLLHAVTWIVAIGIAAHHLHGGRTWLANEPDAPEHLRRPDAGGQGHTQIDFGGQWVMGRMLVLGHGRELYHRQRQWEVVRQGYPTTEETPTQREETLLPRHQRRLARSDEDVGHDADHMLYWFMGKDPEAWKIVGGAAAAPLVVEMAGNPLAVVARTQTAAMAATPAVVAQVEAPAIGGPLYPPVHAFLYAPLGLFDHPQDAYYLFQFIAVGFAILAGRGIAIVSGNRISWPIATIAVLIYPGCRVAIDLGQNPTISLCIALWGWVLVTRRREWAGGAVWGLFAFKPVWGLAFFLVPLVMGRWRVCLAMVGTGAALAACTLPFVGLHSWFDWLAVGAEAAELYNRSQNWINLSRDLQGIPRRFLHNFALPEAERETPLAQAVAWSLWGIVFVSTVLIYRLRADRTKRVGLGPAYLFLGAWLTCYRFMYYDVLLSLVGVACLCAEPWRLLNSRVFGLHFARQSLQTGTDIRPTLAAVQPLGPRLLGYMNSFPLTLIIGLFVLDNLLTRLQIEATIGVLAWGTTSAAPDGSVIRSSPRFAADSSINYPWDTLLILLLWGWCGWRLVRGDDRNSESMHHSANP